MFKNLSKLPLIVAVAAGLLLICCTIPNTKAEEDVLATNALAPETLALEVQGHENISERKARQFGFPPPPPPPPPFGGPFAYPPPPPPPPPPGYFGGGFGGGRRVITRTRYVNRYRGGGGGFRRGYRGGFRG